jgi:hypothetical protein
VLYSHTLHARDIIGSGDMAEIGVVAGTRWKALCATALRAAAILP